MRYDFVVECNTISTIQFSFPTPVEVIFTKKAECHFSEKEKNQKTWQFCNHTDAMSTAELGICVYLMILSGQVAIFGCVPTSGLYKIDLFHWIEFIMLLLNFDFRYCVLQRSNRQQLLSVWLFRLRQIKLFNVIRLSFREKIWRELVFFAFSQVNMQIYYTPIRRQFCLSWLKKKPVKLFTLRIFSL